MKDQVIVVGPPSPPLETVNLKKAIKLKVHLYGKDTTFTVTTFEGRKLTSTVPDPHEHVPYEVHRIAVDSSVVPWASVASNAAGDIIRVSVVWSNVLSTQYEKTTR